MELNYEKEHTQKVYSPPVIEVIDIKLEKGFASSTENFDGGEWPEE